MNKNSNWYYGYVSGMATAATLQPLDNIKMALMVPTSQLSVRLNSNFVKNIYNATTYLHLQQGFQAFYRGLVVNLWKTGLSSAIYFYILRLAQNQQSNRGSFLNFTNSATARVLSTMLTNPFSVIETRYQLPGNDRWVGNVFQNLAKMYKTEGFGSYFKGCKALCFKQAGFAGIYYTLYQKGKQLKLGSLFSGMASGIISTLITHPLQIIRTNRQLNSQINMNKHKTPRHRYSNLNSNYNQKSLLRELVKLAGQGRLFDGVAPRLIKKPAANTIGFLLFEYMESSTSNQ